jgi:hypothetical protein
VATNLCEQPELDRLEPRPRAKPTPDGNGHVAVDPLAVHEGIAYDWLVRGGKRSRPFIILAAYDVLRGAPGTRAAEAVDLPAGVRGRRSLPTGRRLPFRGLWLAIMGGAVTRLVASLALHGFGVCHIASPSRTRQKAESGGNLFAASDDGDTWRRSRNHG